jgi:hypothetical protein
VNATATAPLWRAQDYIDTVAREPQDAVAEAEAMADKHLARTEEVRRVGVLVRWLDDLIRIPGTKFGVGLDPIVGAFLPGIGDAVTGAAAIMVLITALRRGVPGVVIARMFLNIAIDTVGGLIPVAGDAFDFIWRSNYRNLQLLERHQNELEPRTRKSDYLWVGGAVSLVAVSVITPIVFWMTVLAAIL